MILVWQPETDGDWYPLDVPLPVLEVINEVMATVGTDGGNVRTRSDRQAQEVTYLEPGDRVHLVARLEDNSWLKVITKDRQVGWMSRSVLEVNEDSLSSVSAEG